MPKLLNLTLSQSIIDHECLEISFNAHPEKIN